LLAVLAFEEGVVSRRTARRRLDVGLQEADAGTPASVAPASASMSTASTRQPAGRTARAWRPPTAGDVENPRARRHARGEAQHPGRRRLGAVSAARRLLGSIRRALVGGGRRWRGAAAQPHQV